MPKKVLKNCKSKPKRLYDVWRLMKRRCNNYKDTKRYKNYGGRGISVCKEWEESFASFRDWAYENGWNEDNMYSSGINKLSIDRIDNDGNYCPENCRITTNEVQQYNKRNTVYIDYQGKRYTSKELSILLGISQKAILSKFNKGHYKNDYTPRKVNKVEYNGKEYSYSELAEISGISRKRIYERVYTDGWSIKDAVEIPLKSKKMDTKEIRLKAHLTQQEFAKQVGISTASVRKWEQGKYEPRPKAQRKILEFCKIYGIVVE